jgi:uncharacterized damage-inducible protein DinB
LQHLIEIHFCATILKNKFMKLLLFSFILCFGSAAAIAQTTDSIKALYIKDWQRAKAYTQEYLQSMPKEQYNYRAHDSVRTFAQQYIHLAQGTISLMNAATGKKVPDIINRRNLEQSNLPADSVAFFVNLSYDFAIAAVTDFDMATGNERVKRGNFNETRLAWMQKAFEHQTHHRGQTTIYIRLLGIKPPNEKLF